MTLLDPAARRTFDAHAAVRYSELSRARARSGDAPGALAAQVTSDVHKVMSGLWSKASGAAEPAQAFFAMATRAVRPMLTLDGDLDVLGAVDALRQGWSASMRGLNIPAFFSPVDHLFGLGHVTVEDTRSAVLGREPLEAFVAGARARAASSRDQVAVGLAIKAHLVELASQVGDESLASALARWQLIELTAGAGGDVLAAAREVLGPVEWVRLAAALQAVGIAVA
ncbi:hypothetical protein CHO01_22720 [Cellulomonas hominis]|uniref:Uncharacterized protein n=1 Tax=Cellulomonas hominis TaxID=156981 RepID=A0A511FD30_9CELL|nr:hypothetical protein [Cellulomonas hominis]MBB5474602.1 hypothetical protein [Cellulomonas hominis]NKY05475.1 hypothetical protein [Cellulomonas hominis]GEL47156.1 hypothetical protein CHO01_22720 [Cellulomonas hominis]